jgi:hypothetical protein
MDDRALTDVLRRLDLVATELAAIRAELAAAADGLSAPIGANNADDLAPESLLEISTAVERFNRPADTLRWMCRKQGCGVKIGGRWMVSEPRIRRWLNGG